MTDVVASFINWPDNAWDELGTGLVTGVATGLVAVGLFFAQRRSDRHHSRDLLTLEAIEKVRRQTFDLIDAVFDDRHTRRPALDVRRDWNSELSILKPKVDSKQAQLLISEAQQISQHYALRWLEIEEVGLAPDEETGLEDRPQPARSQQLFVALEFRNYLLTLNEELAKWTPSKQKIATSASPASLLAKEWAIPSSR